MTAWSVLTGNSSLPSGTAWQHLNAQQGGGPVNLVLYGETVAELMADLSADLEQADIVATLESVELGATLEAEIGSDIE